MTHHAAAVSAPEAEPHIVDRLIEERAERLMARPWLWRVIKLGLYPLLGYQRARDMADEMAPKGGREAMDWAQDFLGMGVEVAGLDRVPRDGGCTIVANHPGGISDGVAVWQVLKARRPDLCFFANRDALRVCAGLESLVIPVEWRPDRRSRDKTRETLQQAVRAYKDGRCVVVFPAGRMAEWNWRAWRLVEQSWMPTAVNLARRYDTPVIPLGVRQSMSAIYYGLAQIDSELKDITVFHELLAKRGAHYRLHFGAPQAIADLPADDTEATEELREACEALAWRK